MLRNVKAEVVIELVQLLTDNHIYVVIDGGWCVDALLGKQSRAHNDLDIAIPHKDVPRLKELLIQMGYYDIPRDDTRECNFVLGDNAQNLIDVHSYIFDEQGNNIYGVPYLPEQLTGKGEINGFQVKCITPEWIVKFHIGYEIDENDFRDTLALCHAFNIPLPKEFEKYTAASK
jgi:lincosamide nucleotidyltransferase A/C/D/E